jgi:hypothetical protein
MATLSNKNGQQMESERGVKMSWKRTNYKKLAAEQRVLVTYLIEQQKEQLKFYESLIPIWISAGIIIGISILRIIVSILGVC